MDRATIHIASFGLIYSNPKQRDILSSIEVCINYIHFAFFICAFEDLICSLADTLAFTARLRRVARIYYNKINAIKYTFVRQERTKLPKIPSVKFGFECFVSSFRAKANIRQIFNGYTLPLFFSRVYNRFTYRVIYYCCRSFFFATKPFQQPFRVACAFALNGTTNPLSFFSIIIKPYSRMLFTIRSNRNVSESKVNPNKVFNIINRVFWNINGLKKIKLTFFVNQVGFAFNVRNIVSVMANKRHLNSPSYSPKRNNIVRLISHNTTIVTDTTKWFKFSTSFLVKFIGISNFSNTMYKHLRRKSKLVFVRMIYFVMELEIIKYLFLPSYFRNSITDNISLLHCIKKVVGLLFGWKKFYFQCQFHNTNIQYIFTYQKNNLLLFNNLKRGSRIQPTSLKASGFPAFIR